MKMARASEFTERFRDDDGVQAQHQQDDKRAAVIDTLNQFEENLNDKESQATLAVLGDLKKSAHGDMDDQAPSWANHSNNSETRTVADAISESFGKATAFAEHDVAQEAAEQLAHKLTEPVIDYLKQQFNERDISKVRDPETFRQIMDIARDIATSDVSNIKDELAQAILDGDARAIASGMTEITSHIKSVDHTLTSGAVGYTRAINADIHEKLVYVEAERATIVSEQFNKEFTESMPERFAPDQVLTLADLDGDNDLVDAYRKFRSNEKISDQFLIDRHLVEAAGGTYTIDSPQSDALEQWINQSEYRELQRALNAVITETGDSNVSNYLRAIAQKGEYNVTDLPWSKEAGEDHITPIYESFQATAQELNTNQSYTIAEQLTTLMVKASIANLYEHASAKDWQLHEAESRHNPTILSENYEQLIEIGTEEIGRTIIRRSGDALHALLNHDNEVFTDASHQMATGPELYDAMASNANNTSEFSIGDDFQKASVERGRIIMESFTEAIGADHQITANDILNDPQLAHQLREFAAENRLHESDYNRIYFQASMNGAHELDLNEIHERQRAMQQATDTKQHQRELKTLMNNARTPHPRRT